MDNPKTDLPNAPKFFWNEIRFSYVWPCFKVTAPRFNTVIKILSTIYNRHNFKHTTFTAFSESIFRNFPTLFVNAPKDYSRTSYSQLIVISYKQYYTKLKVVRVLSDCAANIKSKWYWTTFMQVETKLKCLENIPFVHSR